MNVRISHSLPYGKPIALGSGTQFPAGSIVVTGEYLGENIFKVLYVVLIPALVVGSINQSGCINSVDNSAIHCTGNVRLKSR